jgi:hypothetical protein
MGKINIGLKQAHLLAQLSPVERLSFIAEGLPLIRDSAAGFWSAAKSLKQNPREKDVLEGFAEEEAAKGLILMDVVRCPATLLGQRLPVMTSWFYNHLARLIYAKATRWKPVNTRQLQEYIDHSRQGHQLEGYAGEYIMPNWEVFRRETQLYVDIASFEDGTPVWNAPVFHDRLQFGDFQPRSLAVVDALHHLGLTTEAGLRATAEVWGAVTFRDTQGSVEARRLTKELLNRAVSEGLPLDTASNDHVTTVYDAWQFPMYLMELRRIDVPLEDLRERQEAMLWAEAGY